ncbi:hypothetical protein DN752_05225 [Echinicola strongylocentroti]|uniref:ASPIC/UnbV domain-containing protein n=1 Tax=Echinicola strongylocentroti TaxID=1795355 RepID=A0A2Z4IFC0_9BACT|nr:VCBS repeat-containing protein [Echinicola strongylocentroti]AWW29575.1 hypothetical protein DN752_05225 [Echinicola strongylocentroti]
MNNSYPTLLLLLCTVIVSCTRSSSDKSSAPLFSPVVPQSSNVHFSNDIIENDTLNYFNFPYLYMGGGVAIGDVNGDDLSDIYLTGNQKPNKLYLNQGDFSFKDVSETAGVQGDGRWYTGTLMADFNQDGWLDIYACVSGKSGRTDNQLFINNQDGTFSEMASTYGLDDLGHSIHATTVDFDRDGLLDVFVANYPLVPVSQGNLFYKELMDQNSWEDAGHLYRNLGNGNFQEVTAEAGIQNFGLTLGVMAADFNDDGWDDLYLSNDFNVPDYFYINNQDGTFREVSQEAMNQTSMFGMGIDVGDVNRDGLLDLVQVDMTPEDHQRSKTNMASMSPRTFYEAVALGFHYQYMQNSLQLNQGSNKQTPMFSNIARYAGIATTDWSWAPLLADLDNDGFADLFVTNGMKRDVNNNDANMEIDEQSFFGNDLVLDINKLPSTPISNYAFKNIDGLQFQKTSKDWGLDQPGFSNGAAYADLDSDGDLDLVINNLGDKASIYENSGTGNSFLRVKLQGAANNPFGIGTKLEVYYQGNQQFIQHITSRGFQSSVEPIVHFGLGKGTQEVDSLVVKWPDGKVQKLTGLASRQELVVHYSDAEEKLSPQKRAAWVSDLPSSSGLDFVHQEDGYDDFQYEPLLPHRNSAMGPGLAVGDIDQDGREDLFIGNGAGYTSQVFVQKAGGNFQVLKGPWEMDKEQEDTGAIWFDADQDGDLDLYVVSGGNDKNKPADYYQDRLYVNMPAGFKKHSKATSATQGISGKTVCPFDVDGDGDLDLFIGGRIVPGHYPSPPKSIILVNNGQKNGDLEFEKLEGGLENELLGLVTDAVVTDLNHDGRDDLVVVGEWMNVTMLLNTPEGMKDVTEEEGLAGTRGWWYTVEKTDLDGDGKADFLLGNLGLNYKYKTSEPSPFTIYLNDFDENGTSDIVLSYEKKGKQLPVRGRECSSQQVPTIAKRFETYSAFASASLEDIYGKKMLENSLSYDVNTFASSWLHRDDEGKWQLSPLPQALQLSAIRDFLPVFINDDDKPDYIATGNLYQSEVETPRNDAGYGKMLLTTTEGALLPVPSSESGLYIKGEVMASSSIRLEGGQQALVFGINSGRLKVVTLDKP